MKTRSRIEVFREMPAYRIPRFGKSVISTSF